jgi:hypothetical protein
MGSQLIETEDPAVLVDGAGRPPCGAGGNHGSILDAQGGGGIFDIGGGFRPSEGRTPACVNIPRSRDPILMKL